MDFDQTVGLTTGLLLLLLLPLSLICCLASEDIKQKRTTELLLQSSGDVWKSRWPSWAPVPNKPTVSVDVKQHSTTTTTTTTITTTSSLAGLIWIYRKLCIFSENTTGTKLTSKPVCSRKNYDWELDSMKPDRKKANVVCNRINLINCTVIWVPLWKHWIRAGYNYWKYSPVKVWMSVLHFNLICVSRKYLNEQEKLNIAFWM